MDEAPAGRLMATCFVFLASRDSSYLSGQVLQLNGDEVVNG